MNTFASLDKLGKQVFALIFSQFILVSSIQAEDVILRHSFAGNLSFELTGNTLRNSNNTCRQINGGSSSGSISLPANSTIKAAYLYWSGSGGIDSSATLNGQTVNADISYTEVFDGRNYYSSKANVSHLVSNNVTSSYQVGNVSFDGSRSYCNTGGAYAGWALAIIYEHPSEPLRVVNVFDGFKSFWGSSFNLRPDNFVIANSPSSLGGKHAHITWEGDEGNSQSLNGQVESLKFENRDLTDSNNPSNNQFNGYSNIIGNTSGVDIDEYQIGNFLTAGATQVDTTYSSGQDAVFLTAELISVPNVPVADLSITQTGPSSFARGSDNAISLQVENLGPNTASANTQITLPLPTGLSLSSFSGNDWSCFESSGSVNCNYLNTIVNSSFSSSLTLTFSVSNATANSISLSATAIGVEFDNILTNNTHSKSYNVVAANLSTSTKEVTDINGGIVQAGDILRYRIDIIETNGIAANGITLIDHLPANISSYSILSLPANIIDNSQPAPAGNNNTGMIELSNINLGANETLSLYIDATINPLTPADTEISNTAILSLAGINDVNIQSASVYVSRPTSPATGNKPLYIRQSSTLSRLQPNSAAFTSIAELGEQTWVINPEFKKEFRFSNSSVNAYLFLQNSYSSGSWGHTVTLSLFHNSNNIGSVERTISVPSVGSSGDNVALFDFTIPLTGQVNIQAGDTLSLKIQNNSDYAEDSLRIYSIDPNTNNSDAVSPYSLISLPAETVINIESIQVKDANTLQPIAQAYPNSNLVIDALVSDPFGSFDITSAEITIKDSAGTILVNSDNMLVLADSGNAQKSFRYNYLLPNDALIGNWAITINAKEGVENEISHQSNYILEVTQAEPIINVVKSVTVFSDPIHGENSSNHYSKALPGAILTYSLTATNTGVGAAENNSIWINDSIPSKTAIAVSDYDNIANNGPIYIDSNNTSGLTYSFISLSSQADDIEFSNNNGVTFDYAPVASSDGTDSNITHFRINPKGVFLAPTNGQASTEFTIKFRVQLQ